MLEDLLAEIDYDIYKTYFEYKKDSDEYQDPENLINIVKDHLSKDKTLDKVFKNKK